MDSFFAALRYEHLNYESRDKVWKNLLRSSGFECAVRNGSIDTMELAKYVLNGREIKNAIRLGMALAQEDGEELSQKVLIETINILNEFNEQMIAAESDWEGTPKQTVQSISICNGETQVEV